MIPVNPEFQGIQGTPYEESQSLNFLSEEHSP